MTFRRGTPADALAAFDLYVDAMSWPNAVSDDERERRWRRQEGLFAHLTTTADRFWLAEHDGHAVGVALSLLRDGVRELSMLFVRPGEQTRGLGSALLARAFPAVGARHRIILATTDPRAQALYLRHGLATRSPVYRVLGEPKGHAEPDGLEARPLSPTPEVLSLLDGIDDFTLGYRRTADHAWRLRYRPGYLYYRDDLPVGYGYVGETSGPFALLDAADTPAVLAHAERVCAEAGVKLELQVPGVNLRALQYLLARGYRIDPFTVHLMNDTPLGHFERYLVSRPMFFL